MEYQLENESLKVKLNASGAELTSIQSKEGIEYLWCGDSKFWGRHAPVLFPIVGRVLDNSYEVTQNGQTKSFHLSQHGFARDCQFQMVEESRNQIVFRLDANDETKEKYPYDFSLRIIYELHHTTVKVTYEVENKDQEPIYFAIGGHPAFNCPLIGGETLEDYEIEFEEKERAKRLLMSHEVYVGEEVEDFREKTIPLSHEFFERGTTILTDLESRTVALKSRRSGHSITMNIEDFPFLGIWSKEEGAPFVCLEPWIGHTDYITASSKLSEKKDFICLEVGRVFTASYTMSFK